MTGGPLAIGDYSSRARRSRLTFEHRQDDNGVCVQILDGKSRRLAWGEQCWVFMSQNGGCGRLREGVVGGGCRGWGREGSTILRRGWVSWFLFCGFVVAFEGGVGEIAYWRLCGGGDGGGTLVGDRKDAWSCGRAEGRGRGLIGCLALFSMRELGVCIFYTWT